MNVGSLYKFSQSLRELPRRVAEICAEEAAPAITSLAHQTFRAAEDAYGVPWRAGSDGKPVSLYKSGALFAKLVYVSIGTKIRVKLGVPYAKYQIGRRPVFPTQGGALPTAYQETLARIAGEVCARELES